MSGALTWVWVALAGGLGAVCRVAVDRWVSVRVVSALPWGTWTVNVSGSFAAGVVAGLAASGLVGPDLRTVVAGGFLGAYTTFSTAMFQAAVELEADQRVAGVLNLVGTLVTSVLAAALGVVLVR